MIQVVSKRCSHGALEFRTKGDGNKSIYDAVAAGIECVDRSEDQTPIMALPKASSWLDCVV